MSLLTLARRRPEAVMFIAGLLLFAVGLGSVIVRQMRPAKPPATDTETQSSSETGPRAVGSDRVGPKQDEAVGPYIKRKKELLQARAAKEGGRTSFALVVFGSYRKAAEAAEFARARKLEVISVQTRIPLDGFNPVDTPLAGKSIEEAAGSEGGPARVGALRDELKELESILKDVDDPEFEQVYKQDAEAHRKAIALLEKDPATLFALVVNATNANLAKLTTAPNVRFVDVPEDPKASPKTHTFVAIVPEDLETAKFGG